MAQPSDQLPILSLRGGYNDTDPQSLIANDQCTIANNVEFFHSSLGERRLGCESLDLTGASLNDETGIVHLSEFFPTTVITAAELWAIAATPSTSVSVAKRTAGVWSVITPDDVITTTAPDIYNIISKTLNAKLFFAYPSAQDRGHVWDGSNLRRTGLKAPTAAPTGADSGGAGTYSGVRYYRVRYVVLSGTTVLLRSEPSTALTVTPSGVNASYTVTKPATISEHETHWELEASTDNATFYRIARTVVGTATYVDSAAITTYSSNTLSESIGAYQLQPSFRFLGVDGDRLVWGGHFTDVTKKSQVGWSPVFSDPGAGNEERFPIVDTGGTASVYYKNLDPTDGGEITGVSDSVNGAWYAFKWSHIYRMSRTSDATNAYDAITISKTRGAVPGSIVSGIDELGRGCIYFLDPQFGPSRIGLFGLQTIRGLRTTWRKVNTLATKVTARGVYYPDKQQVLWVVATDTNNSPTLGLKLQVTETRSDNSLTGTGGEGASRGWSLFDSKLATAYTMCILHEVVSGDPTPLVYTLRARPFGGYVSPDFIQRWDTGTTDNGTAFKAVIRTKPFIVAGLLQKWGALVGSLLAVSNAGLSVVVRLIRDFGVETSEDITVDLLPENSEPIVVKDLDNLAISGARAIAVEFSDPS